MLIEKEVLGLGTIWSKDLKTGKPRKAIVTSQHLQHWHDEGNKMLAAGLTVPVPCEHDFEAHPMTPADKLKNNAGWVKEYKLRDNRLYSVLDIQDEELAKKLPTTIKWTSPWFSSFIDGAGRKWDNVIAHMALTTRPVVTNQAPFPSIAAAIEAAIESPIEDSVLCQAGQLKLVDNKLSPEFPVAFSMYSGIALSEEELKEAEKKETPKDPLRETPTEDMKIEKLLCDLLCILGVAMPAEVNPADFKKVLYQATMLKIKELSSKTPVPIAPVPGKKPAPNPIVQESQPMYMSLEDINKIPDETMRNIALSMYNENVKLQAALDKTVKDTGALRDSKLAEENAKRKLRSDRLSRISPRVKADLDIMLALPSMALSLGDNGVVVDPMGQTLSVLEKGLADIPRILSTELTTEVPHPTDGELSQEVIDKTADDMARMMGCPPEQKKAG